MEPAGFITSAVMSWCTTFPEAVELWFVLDYVLYLEEAGYRVTLGTFCDRADPP